MLKERGDGTVEGPDLPKTKVVIVYREEGWIIGDNPSNHELVDVVYKQEEK